MAAKAKGIAERLLALEQAVAELQAALAASREASGKPASGKAPTRPAPDKETP